MPSFALVALVALAITARFALFLAIVASTSVAVVVVSMGAIAAWGIQESIKFVGVMTLIEVGGLAIVIVAGMLYLPGVFSRIPEMLPPLQATGTVGAILSTTLLAVLAFIGFESLANVAEEVIDPPRTIPRAIFLTLIIATVLYMLVVWIALLAVPIPELVQSSAPLALVFERLTGLSPRYECHRDPRDAQRRRCTDYPPRGFFTASVGQVISPQFLLK